MSDSSQDNKAQVPGSSVQETMLRILCKRGHTQVAGYGRAKWLSASRALVKRGLAYTFRTGWFGATEAGKAWNANNPKKD